MSADLKKVDFPGVTRRVLISSGVDFRRPAMHHARHLISPLAMVILALTGIANRCPAQGTSGVFPEPMNWQAFQELAEPLALSGEQLQAMQPVHEQYLREMMTLRDGPIADFIEDERALGMPNRDLDGEGAEDRIDDFRTVHRRMAAIEREFFDGIAPGLGPSQLERLQIARDWRQRQRLLEANWPWIHYAPSMNRVKIELRPMVPWDRLDGDSTQTIERELATWEQQRTRLAQQLFEHRLKGWVREREQDAELGPIEMGDLEADPEVGLEHYRNEQFRRHREAYEQALSTTAKIRVHTRNGLEAIASRLPERLARDLKWTHWKRSYGRGGGMDFRRILVKTIDDPPSEDVDVDSLEALLSEHDAAIRPHMDELTELVEKDDEIRGATFFFTTEEDEESPMGRVRLKMRDRNIATARRFQNILGGDTPDGISRWLAMLDGQANETPDETPMEAEISVGFAVEGDEGLFTEEDAVVMGGTPGQMQDTMDMFGSAPEPLSSEELELLVADLQIEPDGREVVDVLFETYQGKAANIRRTFRSSQQQAMIRMAGEAGGGRGMAAKPELIIDFDRKMKTLLDQARSDMMELDDQLFDDLVLAIERAEDKVILEWYRMSRERERTGGSSMMSNVMDQMGGGMNQGWTINVFKLVASVEMAPEERRRVLDALADWHGPVTELVRRNGTLDEQIAGFMNQMISLQSNGFDEEELEKIRTVVDDMTAVQTEQERLRQELLERNRTGVAAMIEVMPNENGVRLRNAFRMASFPAVYRDPHSMTDLLLAASRLEGLEDGVRAEIYELQKEYDARYHTHCGQLVEIFERMPPLRTAGFAMEQMEQREKDRREADRIRFERDDYSDKTRDRLRNLLTPEQVDAVGGLKPVTSNNLEWPQF